MNVIDLIEDINPDAITIIGDAYNQSIIGITEDDRVIYDYYKMIDNLMELEQMEYEEAMEYIEYNIVRAIPYMGELAPIIMYKLTEE